jgi:hypothetical protein
VISQPPSALGGWVQSLPLTSLLMDALPRPKSHEKRSSLRIVSDLTAAEVQIVANEFARGLERVLMDGVRSLSESFTAMDQKMKKKSEDHKRNAASKFSICQEMKCGTIEDFHRGLVGRIGNS